MIILACVSEQCNRNLHNILNLFNMNGGASYFEAQKSHHFWWLGLELDVNYDKIQRLVDFVSIFDC